MDKKLLEILGCPVDKNNLKYEDGKLVCTECHRVYEIKDGIPQMLIKDYSYEEFDEK